MEKMKNIIKDNDFDVEIEKFTSYQEVNHVLKLKKFISIARNLSIQSQFDIYRFGAVITLKDKVIASGYNSPKSHPMQKHYNNKFKKFIHDNSQHGIHAEMQALQELKKIMKKMNINVKKLEITIYRSGRDDTSKLGRPCAGCMGAIKEMGIPIVHYTTPHGIATEYITDKNLHVKKAKKII